MHAINHHHSSNTDLLQILVNDIDRQLFGLHFLWSKVHIWLFEQLFIWTFRYFKISKLQIYHSLRFIMLLKNFNILLFANHSGLSVTCLFELLLSKALIVILWFCALSVLHCLLLLLCKIVVLFGEFVSMTRGNFIHLIFANHIVFTKIEKLILE